MKRTIKNRVKWWIGGLCLQKGEEEQSTTICCDEYRMMGYVKFRYALSTSVYGG